MNFYENFRIDMMNNIMVIYDPEYNDRDGVDDINHDYTEEIEDRLNDKLSKLLGIDGIVIENFIAEYREAEYCQPFTVYMMECCPAFVECMKAKFDKTELYKTIIDIIKDYRRSTDYR